MNKKYLGHYGQYIQHTPRQPLVVKPKDAAARQTRRRIEDIKEASRLERDVLLEVYELDPNEIGGVE